MRSSPTPETPPTPSRARRRSATRRIARWFLLLLIMALASAFVLLVFINKVGLPEFLKKQVVAQLGDKGLEVEFSRMRLRWHRGIVVDDLHLTGRDPGSAPQIFADEAQLRLDRDALTHRQLRIAAVVLNTGRLLWPITATNQPTRTLHIHDVKLELHLHPRDEWELRDFHARLQGIELELQGRITNGSALRRWKRDRLDKSPRETRAYYQGILTKLQRLRLEQPAILKATIHGDAREMTSWNGTLSFTTPGVDSPWLQGSHLALTARTAPGADHQLLHTEIELVADRLRRGPLEAGPIKLTLRGTTSPEQPVPTNVAGTLLVGRIATANVVAHDLELSLETDPAPLPLRPGRFAGRGKIGTLATSWGSSSGIEIAMAFATNTTHRDEAEGRIALTFPGIKGDWGSNGFVTLKLETHHGSDKFFPSSVAAQLGVARLHTPRIEADTMALVARAAIPPRTNMVLIANDQPWPERLANIPFDATVQGSGINFDGVAFPALGLSLDWKSPRLVLQTTNHLESGDVGIEATLDTMTRELLFAGKSTFDAQQIRPLLTTNTQRWIRKYSWQEPPRVEAAGRILMPAWTNRHPDWRGEVLPTLSIAGQFEVGPAAYRDIPFSSARSPIFFTNMMWHLPRLVIARPEGTIEADYTSDQRTRAFHWRLRSNADVKAIKPLLTKESQQRALDYFEFSRPPQIEADVWGSWNRPESVGIFGYVAVTNFSFRGEKVRDAVAQVHYTNKYLSFIAPDVQRDGERGQAAGVGVNLDQKTVILTNAFGNLNPYAVATAIGKKVSDVMAPYRFDSSPTVRANGLIDYSKGGRNTDVRFELEGGPFHWKVFHLDQIKGNIEWLGRKLYLTNIQSQAHRGLATGYASFDFTPTNGAKFSFQTAVAGIDLRSLLGSMGMRTNRLEGILDAELHIASADTANTNSWAGDGKLQLRDGLIWDIPVFGVFSPILNTLLPGLGNSRARQATATLEITNSVIQTRDLEIDATAMRMRYQGVVTFDTRIQGRMEAELLRNLPGFGLVISKLFWPVTKVFEYRITGTLAQPKPEPVSIIPRILFLPLQPIKTIKDLIPDPPPNPPQKNEPN